MMILQNLLCVLPLLCIAAGHSTTHTSEGGIRRGRHLMGGMTSKKKGMTSGSARMMGSMMGKSGTMMSSSSSSSEDASTTPAPTPDDCVSIDQAETLKDAIVAANGSELRLCSTNIAFQQQLQLSAIPVNLVCDGTCIFDGNNSTRLFAFGTRVFPNESPADYAVNFKGFTFTRGEVTDGSTGKPRDEPPHGGAFMFVGLETSRARFEDCVFRANNAILENGGAIFAIGRGSLDFINCSFERNFAYNGGAISANNVIITISDTSFVNNTAIGNYEGAAIYVDGEEGSIFCEGDSNVFKGNTLLPDIVIFPQSPSGCDDY
jgi:predicted outer membrane repeat protein